MLSKRRTEIGGCLFAGGAILLVIGFLLTIVYWFMSTQSDLAAGGYTNHPGLMNDRIVGVIVGIGWTIASLLILGAAWKICGSKSQN